MFELRSKLNREDKFEIDTATMCLFKTIMYHAKVTEQIIERFSLSKGTVIGEKLGKEIANKLENVLPLLVSGVLVERKMIENGHLIIKTAPINLGDLVYLKAFILFCEHKSPFEIY